MPKQEKLNLPIVKGAFPAPRHLTMDDYFKFVALNLKYVVDRKAVRKQKRLAVVDVPFSLKSS